MPRKEVHESTAIAAGMGFAAYQAKGQPTAKVVLETIGGGIGGWITHDWPDILEPGISSWHRGGAHSCVTGGVVVGVAEILSGMAQACREGAAKCEALASNSNSSPEKHFDPIAALFVIAAILLTILAGVINGMAIGYVSHLALDAMTPRSLPVLCKGF